MPSVDPLLIIRLGTHAEKEYLEKMISMLDGFMIAANLLEATPNATSSLLVKLAGKKKKKDYYLDPMTYGYGLNLEFLKSDRKVKGKIVHGFKPSYTNLATSLGGIFEDAIKRDASIKPHALSQDDVIGSMCKSVAEYQLFRAGTEWAGDEEFASYSGDIPKPAAILTPYFFIGGKEEKKWLELVPRFARSTVSLGLDYPVHSVVCADESILYDKESLDWLKLELPKTGVDGVWFWFSNFNEHSAQPDQLIAFKDLVLTLSSTMDVYNMHGGYFSFALSRYGLKGTAHGIGYGEQKDVAPVQGQAMPTVRYYLPDVKKRLGIPDLERSFNKLGIVTPDGFFEKICDCAICKGVLKDGLKSIQSFGELHYANAASKRRSQTATAAKLCRFHFLIRRIKERDQIKNQSLADIDSELAKAWEIWSKQPTIANDADHLTRWRNALSGN